MTGAGRSGIVVAFVAAQQSGGTPILARAIRPRGRSAPRLPPIRRACDSIFNRRPAATVRTFLPILATLALTAGLYVPVARVMLARRVACGSPDAMRAVMDRVSVRPIAQGPADGMPLAWTQELQPQVAVAGPVRPADPVIRALGSGWWLTPPGPDAGRTSAPIVIPIGCDGPACAPVARVGWMFQPIVSV